MLVFGPWYGYQYNVTMLMTVNELHMLAILFVFFFFSNCGQDSLSKHAARFPSNCRHQGGKQKVLLTGTIRASIQSHPIADASCM